ncbi:MAG: UDP-N-acetylglucosamine diphosphorylase/glucosamine-1-phosphate N-acetyltransferase [Proteobacteria bacterium]|nr:UDP-N-acetylglucosamine diphosphorylase/glucosamine-1-phosphate N-acetyltransferase [Pseudomonadota bacterium]
MTPNVIILAAGKGSRMKSNIPKVLHSIAGEPMLHRVIKTAAQLAPEEMHLVLGHGIDQIEASLNALDGPLNTVLQAEQLGTGHAVKIALAHVPDDGVSLVLYGDVPLITHDTLAECVAAAQLGHLSIVTAEFSDPAQLGRIARNDAGYIEAIIEYKDASDDQRAITEINSGILAAPTHLLRNWLNRIEPNNTQGEYYLTDIVSLAVADGVAVHGIVVADENEVMGVNDRAQLAEAERLFQGQQTASLMAAGVSFADPARVDIRGSLSCGIDCFIDINTVFIGDVSMGEGVTVGPGVVVEDSTIGGGVRINAHTVIEGAIVAEDCQLGPFARIRPGSNFAAGVKIGNFVETKKASLGKGAKASHLTYLGDAIIGPEVNIGAGTVTCNYDGVDKHQTTIGKRAFIGTNSTLVAPLEIGDDAFVAAGSTVTSTVEPESLAVGRARQRTISKWLSPIRRRKRQE